jgi:putative peptide zinc metalloprotease protein
MVQSRRDHVRSRGKTAKDLQATLRIHGLVSSTWAGEVTQMEESEAKSVPIALSSKGGGPVAVKASPGKGGALIPQTQHYLVYVDIDKPDSSISPGVLAQVKIHCRHETCLKWLWRTVNQTFDLRLL